VYGFEVEDSKSKGRISKLRHFIRQKRLFAMKGYFFLRNRDSLSSTSTHPLRIDLLLNLTRLSLLNQGKIPPWRANVLYKSPPSIHASLRRKTLGSARFLGNFSNHVHMVRLSCILNSNSFFPECHNLVVVLDIPLGLCPHRIGLCRWCIYFYRDHIFPR